MRVYYNLAIIALACASPLAAQQAPEPAAAPAPAPVPAPAPAVAPPPPPPQAEYPPCSKTLQDQCTNTRRESDTKGGTHGRKPRRR